MIVASHPERHRTAQGRRRCVQETGQEASGLRGRASESFFEGDPFRSGRRGHACGEQEPDPQRRTHRVLRVLCEYCRADAARVRIDEADDIGQGVR